MALMTYAEWRAYKKMVMGDTPRWFDDPAECRRRFEGYCDAFAASCSEANPMDAAFVPRGTAVMLPALERPVAQPPVAQRFWVAAFALIMQLAVLTGPAFAAGDAVVNGNPVAFSAPQEIAAEKNRQNIPATVTLLFNRIRS